MVDQLRVPAGNDPEFSGNNPFQKDAGDVLGLENTRAIRDGAGFCGPSQVLGLQLRRVGAGGQEKGDANVVRAKLVLYPDLASPGHPEWRRSRLGGTALVGRESRVNFVIQITVFLDILISCIPRSEVICLG
jgi:hypothetical protein